MARAWNTMVVVAALALLLSMPGQTALASDVSTSTDPFTSRFGEYMKDILDQWKVPGMSIAVVDGSETYAQGYGYATLPDTPATPDTMYYAGSTTKAFTAAALAQLIDTKRYPALSKGWATTISSIIREDFVLQDSWATAHLTLEDAVSHRTGMPRHDLSWARRVDGRRVTTRDTVRNLRNLPFSAEPRARYQYCNLMYIVLSHVIETLTGKWLGDALRELIWGPLEMNATYFDVHDALKAPQYLASGYYWDNKTAQYERVPFESNRQYSGAGATTSSVRDYAKWVKCLLHEAEPFSPSAHRDIKTPRVVSSERSYGWGTDLYGLAWERAVAHGRVVYKHGGSDTAYGAQVFWIPEIKYGIVAFANAAFTSGGAESVVVWKLIEDKLQVPPSERYAIGEKMKDEAQKMKLDLGRVDDILYQNRSQPPQPSPLKPSQLVGSYYDRGYGTLDLVEERHPDKPNETMLVAHRTEMCPQHQLRFSHVSGDFWTVYLWTDATRSTDSFMGGKFKFGVDGAATGLELQLSKPNDGDEGIILFRRVE